MAQFGDSRESQGRKFAVVQWTEGEDIGKYSDVKTGAIQGYDDTKMDDHGNPISKYSAYIEWRHGRKTRGGWPHYRGHVIFVSASRFETMQKLSSSLKMEKKREEKELTKVVVAP